MFGKKHMIVAVLLIAAAVEPVSAAFACQITVQHQSITDSRSISKPVVVGTPDASPISVSDLLVSSFSVPDSSAPVGATVIPSAFHLEGIKPIRQGWNDCGPANIVQALQFYGWTGTQDQAITELKPNYNDLNVSAWELVRFADEQPGFSAVSRINGTLPLLKQLVAANFAVILEISYFTVNDGWVDHFVTVLGYDDQTDTLFVGDTLTGFGSDGLGQRYTYAEIDDQWHDINRGYTVVYPTARQAELNTILGSDADAIQNATHSAAVAKADTEAAPDNAFNWFNLGSSLTVLGRYKAAAAAFDQARLVTGTPLPWQMFWYQFTPYEAYYNSGQYDKVLALANTMLATPYLEETWYWRGMAEAAKGENDVAIKDFNTAIQFNPNFTNAIDAKVSVASGEFMPSVMGKFAYTAPSPPS